MNIFTFTGGLGADAETKSTQGGTSVCSFPVAVNSGYGENKKTTWVRCNLFGKRAEGNLPNYLVKGAQVAISGELTLEQWESNGEKKSALKLNVNSLDLIGGKTEQAPQAPQVQQHSGFDDSFNDSIPF